MKRKSASSLPKGHVIGYLEEHQPKLPINKPLRVRFGKHIDWRYFAKRVPQYRDQIFRIRKDQLKLRELHARLLSRGVIRAE